jgi:hypothetical protein
MSMPVLLCLKARQELSFPASAQALHPGGIMALVYDHNYLPTCCGVGLVPGDPYTACQICLARFDTQNLAEEMMRLKTVAAAKPATPRHAAAA